MKTVAESAGVSRATVSYVLNGRHHEQGLNINPETVLKVEAAATELGYRRNEIARSVRTGKTNVFGFIGAMEASYTMDIISGIATTCEINNYLLKFFQLDHNSDIALIAKQCIEQRLSGVICRSLSEQQLDILHLELQAFNIPIVLVDNSFSHDWCSRVISDDIVGAQLAVDHLLKLGHRKIINISNSQNSAFSAIRHDGYCKALAAAGIKDSGRLIFIDVNYNFTERERMALQKILLEDKPTALFCSSDPIAMRVIQVATALGLNIPEDISVIGYAGLNYSALATPPLTTVKQPFVDMGKTATKILIDEVIKKTPIREVKLAVELIVRKSTAPVND